MTDENLEEKTKSRLESIEALMKSAETAYKTTVYGHLSPKSGPLRTKQNYNRLSSRTLQQRGQK